MTEYANVLDFSKLPLETRIDILATLNSYNECHVNLWKDGKRTVEVDWYLVSNNYDKPVLEYEFRKEDFDKEALEMGYMLKYGKKSPY